ncbi:hypothetical protein CEUSTIGMA_g14007.t1 [Chlamydomonas eustigma]|uniref:Uncharacterized protein n=1 Tax=Chlamydomonas eustigma TaxID=1157962 RepID=A0A250XUF2_9CHLO|nr:hypothetical protein CEUSTIGMA_g14007.t1 [Chlamydomonas eustigma]|eukprot:GAX86599.1 hypothetical protein CEUSTIGMA_g14007.t1 [Chlamydomonas eustigma]
MQNVISSPMKRLSTTVLKALVSAIPQRGEVLVCGACALVGRLRLLTEDFEEEGKKMPSKYAPRAKQLCVGSSAINHLESNGTKIAAHKNASELSRVPGVSPALVACADLKAIKAINLSEAVAWWTETERADSMYTLRAEVDVDSPPDTKKRNVDLVTNALNHLPPQALQQLRQVKDGEVDSLSAQQEAEILAVLKRQKVQLGEQSGPSCSAQPSPSGVSGAANSAFNFLMSPEFNIDGIVNKALPSSDRMEGGDSYEDNEEVQGPFFQQHQSKPPRPALVQKFAASHAPMPRTGLEVGMVGQLLCPKKDILKLAGELITPDTCDDAELTSAQVIVLQRLTSINYGGLPFLQSWSGTREGPLWSSNRTISHSINDVDRDSARKAELSIGVTDFYQALEEVGEDLNRLLRDGFEGLGAPPFAWLRGLHVEDVHSRMQAIQSEKNKYDQPKLLMDTAAAAYSSGARQMQKSSDAFTSKLADIEEERTQLMEYKEKARYV